MGATVLNGAKIGANCLIGANALITERKAFPDHSVIIGAPARVVRTADAGTLQLLRESAADYVVRWQRYTRGLARVG
jgi:carbonic anhydrase/acetyltransferase-like protein (isoleucine patch superfamily)